MPSITAYPYDEIEEYKKGFEFLDMLQNSVSKKAKKMEKLKFESDLKKLAHNAKKFLLTGLYGHCSMSKLF